jgi:sensor histidine kinase YesM
MKNRIFAYWACQILGWGLFVLGNVLTAPAVGNDLAKVYNVSLMIFIMGIGITHSFRWGIHKWGWKGLNIPALIPRILISSLFMSALFVVFNTALTDLLYEETPLVDSFFEVRFVLNVVNFFVLFFLWNTLYFALNTFENWKKEEIQNLELRAAKTEIELNSFKSQMNPHFMFNSLNSIRALVDEDPNKAKQAITMLSGIMRNNLLLGKRQIVSLREELDLVEKYLSIEQIRFEERLHIEYDIHPETFACDIPPFMLQTIVENGIKHGVSKIIAGGLIKISCKKENGFFEIEVVNSGNFQPDTEREGFGLANTKKRLELIYNGKANFEIANQNDFVVTKLSIPTNF